MEFADQDSVRLLAVESCGPFAQKLSADDNYLLLLPIVQKLVQVCPIPYEPLLKLMVAGRVVACALQHCRGFV